MNVVERPTFAELVAGREREFPLLARAAGDTRRALNPKCEWMLEKNGELFFDWNYCELVRAADVTDLLRKAEKILRYGYRRISHVNNRACGGCIYLLGRPPKDGDVFALRTLREPMAWRGELIAEFTLEAIRASEVPADTLSAAAS